MSKNTLVLITNSLLARIDIDTQRDARVDLLERRERPTNASLDELIAAALSMSVKTPHPVWLFLEDMWTGFVGIPSDLHAIANSDEINQAAKLEAEENSGLSAFQSKVATKRIEDDARGNPQYWVTQILDVDLAKIEGLFLSSRIKWLGIAHPWPRAVFANAGPYLLESETQIRSWAIEVALELATKILQRPCFSVPPKVITQKQQTIWAAVLASLSVASCGLGYVDIIRTSQNIAHLSQDLAKKLEANERLVLDVQRAESRLIDKRKALQADQARYDALWDETELLKFNQALLSGHCSNLLDALATTSDEDSWLQRIETDGLRTTLKGIALNEASAHRFASGLSLQSEMRGHEVGPAQTTPLAEGVFEFSISVDLVKGTGNTSSIKKSIP